MKKNVFVLLLVALVVSVFAVSEVLAECPDGKSPISISTPSGKSKTLCIPDAAVHGIETAAEHSSGAINPNVTCPCWSAADLEGYKASYEQFSCEIDPYKNISECWQNDSDVYAKLRVITNYGGATTYCVNNFEGRKFSGFSEEELNECIDLLVDYSTTVPK